MIVTVNPDWDTKPIVEQWPVSGELSRVSIYHNNLYYSFILGEPPKIEIWTTIKDKYGRVEIENIIKEVELE